MLRKCFAAFLFIILMSVQNVTLVKAESVYEESLTLHVGLGNMNCIASLEFTVSSPNGPIDTAEFTSEPSFVSLYVYCDLNVVKETDWETPTTNYTFYYSTKVIICLNMTKLTDFNQGKFRADALKRKFEDLLKVLLFCDERLSQASLAGFGNYYYLTEVPSVEKLWYAFLGQEYPGLSELFSLNPNIGTPYIWLRLDKIADQYRWTYQINGLGVRFPVSFNKEYTVSLNEILGHVGVISSAPRASVSNVTIQVFTGNGNWTFMSLGTTPEMSKTQDSPERITFKADITGNSYNDIKLRFKIVESGEDLTTMYVAATIFGALFCIAGFYLLRRRRTKPYRYRL